MTINTTCRRHDPRIVVQVQERALTARTEYRMSALMMTDFTLASQQIVENFFSGRDTVYR